MGSEAEVLTPEALAISWYLVRSPMADDSNNSADSDDDLDALLAETADADGEEAASDVDSALLDSLQRHLRTFAPSGIVDLSERGLATLGRRELDFDALEGGPVQILSLIHISEPTRRTPISYAVFCLKKKT